MGHSGTKQIYFRSELAGLFTAATDNGHVNTSTETGEPHYVVAADVETICTSVSSAPCTS